MLACIPVLNILTNEILRHQSVIVYMMKTFSAFFAETGCTAKKVYRLAPRTAPIGFYTVPYQYRRGFAIYRLAKYRCTAKIFLRVSKLESTHYYIYTQPELPIGNYNDGKDTTKFRCW